MNKIKIIFLKEFKDMMRDRRTIFFMVFFPLFFIPVMIGLFPLLMSNITEKKMTEVLTIAIVGSEYAPELDKEYQEGELLELVYHLNEEQVTDAIKNEEINGALVFYPDFQTDIEKMIPTTISMYFRSSKDMEAAKKRLKWVLDAYGKKILATRYDKLNLSQENFQPFDIQYNNVATKKEMVGKMAGGFLPYIFLLQCFMGAMYPALDLGAGEKERRTLETILVSPASRLEILLGKFGVIAFFGISSAMIGILGLYLGLNINSELPLEIQAVVQSVVNFKTIITILFLIIPIAIFFAAILLSLSIYAKTYKEAQSIVAPFNIVIFIPMIIGMVPGIELNPLTAMIPILNISLATKEVLAETISPLLLGEVYLSLIILSSFAIYLATKLFKKEEVIFRG